MKKIDINLLQFIAEELLMLSLVLSMLVFL